MWVILHMILVFDGDPYGLEYGISYVVYACFGLVYFGYSYGYLVVYPYSNLSKDTCLVYSLHSHTHFDSSLYLDSSYLLL